MSGRDHCSAEASALPTRTLQRCVPTQAQGWHSYQIVRTRPAATPIAKNSEVIGAFCSMTAFVVAMCIALFAVEYPPIDFGGNPGDGLRRMLEKRILASARTQLEPYIRAFYQLANPRLQIELLDFPDWGI